MIHTQVNLALVIFTIGLKCIYPCLLHRVSVSNTELGLNELVDFLLSLEVDELISFGLFCLFFYLINIVANIEV